jgi:hypothetical protein
MNSYRAVVLAGSILLLGASMGFAQAHTMSFFVTSVGVGDGANLGGLEGADAHCQALAETAGFGQRTWRAYLSTEAPDTRGISARDRIGIGPWYNALGELIASDLDELHLNPNIVKRTALDEHGHPVPGRGDSPNEHDMLTGTQEDGTAYAPDAVDHTCNNWTSNNEGNAQVGHHDRHGGGNTSWNAAHATTGCSQAALQSTGGAGLFYCFAAD